MKKVLILGAGIYQVPLIKKVKEMGYYVIVSSSPGDYPGFQYADKVYYENTVDKEAILKVAQEEQIQAILTTGTDVAVSTIGYVCDQMNLSGVSHAAAIKVTNKALMKEVMVASGARTALFEKIYSLEDAFKACDKLRYPVIFKCVDKSGSRGIYRVFGESDIETAFAYAMDSTDLDYIIVEEFIEGYEIGVDGYIGDDEYVIIPHDKIIYNNGVTNVPVGHVFPYECSDELTEDIKKQIINAANALGLKNTFFNADVMIRDNKSYIIEIGARCGATCIPELLSIYLGIDYYEVMIKNALGEKISFPDKPVSASAGELLVSETTGIIREVDMTQVTYENVDQLFMDYNVGDKVNAFRVGPDRIGQIVVRGKSVKEAMDNIALAKKQLKIIVE